MDKKIAIRYTAPFVAVDKEIFLCETLSIYEKMVYCVLCAFANSQDGTCFPSYQTIAKKAGCSRRKVIEVIAALETRGLVEKESQSCRNGRSTSNLYTMKSLSGTKTDNVENYVENVGRCTEAEKQDKAGGESLAPGERAESRGASDSPDCGAPCSPGESAPDTSCGAYPARDSAQGAHEQEVYINTYLNKNQSSNNPVRVAEDGRGELDEWKEKIEYDFFAEVMPDKLPLVDSLLISFLAEAREGRREAVQHMDSCTVMELLHELKGMKFGHVRNFIPYLRKVVLSYLQKRNAALAAA